MKLAEALQARADLNTRIAQLKTRILNNTLVQEGEKTAETPEALIKQLNECIAQLQELMTEINLTNSSVKADGKTLTEWIAVRDTLKVRLSIYRDLVNEASALTYRARGTEIKIKSTINVTKLQKEVDAMAKELRLVDNRIQETNWKTELK